MPKGPVHLAVKPDPSKRTTSMILDCHWAKYGNYPIGKFVNALLKCARQPERGLHAWSIMNGWLSLHISRTRGPCRNVEPKWKRPPFKISMIRNGLPGSKR